MPAVDLLLNLALIAAGLVLLKYGADYLLSGAVAIARHFKLPDIVIGLTIVAVGTSAPELVTAISAALRHAPGIVLGNAIGSNVANLTLVLGAGALLDRIPVSRELLFVQKPALVVLTVLSAVLLWDGSLGRVDGAILVLLIIGFTVWLLRRGEVPSDDPVEATADIARPLWIESLWLLGGLGGLILGAAWLVQGAAAVAQQLGVGSTAIGATVVALGTSAPELAATFAAVRRKRYSILLGNLIGSCQFNLALIMGVPALITPIPAERSILLLHLPVLMLATLWAWIIFYTHGQTIRRREGAVCIALYLAYAVLTFVIK
jgi:cation:H+ antiporter